jgi:hypothetical protein
MVSKGMALECSLIYFIPIRLPADILLAKDKIPVKPLSGNNTHSNRDAGLHGAGRIMVGYLKHILAILSRSSSMRAPMRCKQPRKASDFFFEEAKNSDWFSCISNLDTYPASYSMFLTRSDEFGA